MVLVSEMITQKHKHDRTKKKLGYGIVYKITHLPTKMLYVGQTKQTLKVRILKHLSDTNSGRLNGKLQEAFRADADMANFCAEVIREVPVEELLQEEQKAIVELGCVWPLGFNMDTGGQVGRKPIKAVTEDLAKKSSRRKYTDSPKPLNSAPRGIRASPKSKWKPVIGTNIDTGEEVFLEYGSARPLEFDPRLISACCKGKRKFHRGHSWRFA